MILYPQQWYLFWYHSWMLDLFLKKTIFQWLWDLEDKLGNLQNENRGLLIGGTFEGKDEISCEGGDKVERDIQWEEKPLMCLKENLCL